MIDRPVALVTGGSRGIGRAVSIELGRLGHAVVVNYATRPEAAHEVASQILSLGAPAITVQADVGLSSDRNRLVEQALKHFGRVDVLVNNAGITSVGRRDILEATEESWDQVFATNLKGPFFLTQLVAREMIRLIRAGNLSGGKIINISSVSAYAVSTNRADYCMTKAALAMMTKLFAVRLAEENIQVFEICPGVIATDMTAPVKEKYDRLIAEGLWPIRRWGQPEDVARAVAAIVQDAFSFSTGMRLDIDGGFHIRVL